jgi:hypothetical protein
VFALELDTAHLPRPAGLAKHGRKAFAVWFSHAPSSLAVLARLP